MKSRFQADKGFVNPELLARNQKGDRLCRRCGKPLPSNDARRTFCSGECVHQHKLRTDPGYMRQCVVQRDGGICVLCGFDSVKFKAEFHRMFITERRRVLSARGWPLHRETFWDADHIVPVAEGGGQCDLDNIRTLCIDCHKRETAALRARLAAKRKEPDASDPTKPHG